MVLRQIARSTVFTQSAAPPIPWRNPRRDRQIRHQHLEASPANRLPPLPGPLEPLETDALMPAPLFSSKPAPLFSKRYELPSPPSVITASVLDATYPTMTRTNSEVSSSPSTCSTRSRTSSFISSTTSLSSSPPHSPSGPPRSSTFSPRPAWPEPSCWPTTSASYDAVPGPVPDIPSKHMLRRKPRKDALRGLRVKDSDACLQRMYDEQTFAYLNGAGFSLTPRRRLALVSED